MHVSSPKLGIVQPSTNTFRVRPARRGDAEAIRSLLTNIGFARGGDAATVHWLISHPEMEIFVASDSHDRAIGVVTLSHRPRLQVSGRIATIDELVVSPPWRRRGVGRELLRHAVDRARVLDVKSLEFQVPTEEPHLGDFCRACGFVEGGSAVFRLASLTPKR